MITAEEGRAPMGFRPDYQLPRSEELAWHLLGNAVAPPVAADVLATLQVSL